MVRGNRASFGSYNAWGGILRDDMPNNREKVRSELATADGLIGGNSEEDVEDEAEVAGFGVAGAGEVFAVNDGGARGDSGKGALGRGVDGLE